MKDGESITITDLPAGVQYHVEEAEANQDGYTTSVSHADSTISAGGSAEAKFVNDKPGTSGHDKPSSGKTSETARKEWKDTGEKRPGYILVQLMRNSKAYGNPIYLRSENGWQYAWTNLNRDDQWSVQEVQVPDGYQVSVSYVVRSGPLQTPRAIHQTSQTSRTDLIRPTSLIHPIRRICRTLRLGPISRISRERRTGHPKPAMRLICPFGSH